MNVCLCNTQYRLSSYCVNTTQRMMAIRKYDCKQRKSNITISILKSFDLFYPQIHILHYNQFYISYTAWDYDSLSCSDRTYPLEDFTDILLKKPGERLQGRPGSMDGQLTGRVYIMPRLVPQTTGRRNVYHSLTERIYQFFFQLFSMELHKH